MWCYQSACRALPVLGPAAAVVIYCPPGFNKTVWSGGRKRWCDPKWPSNWGKKVRSDDVVSQSLREERMQKL
eukprot:9838610-Karenia_brevis.AAC.1